MNEKSLKKKQSEDLATKRILAVFVMAAAVLWGMSRLYDVMTYGSTFMLGQVLNNVLLAVSALAAAVLVVLYVLTQKRGTASKDRVLDTGFFALCALTVCASSLILAVDFYNGMHILYVFLPVVAVLYLVYYIYERQFFSFCTASVMAISASYWSYSNGWERLPALVLAGLMCVAVMVLAVVNCDKLAKLQEAVLGKQFDKRYTLLIYAAMLVLMVAATMMEGKIALIIALAMGIYLVAAAVYYTIKAM